VQIVRLSLIGGKTLGDIVSGVVRYLLAVIFLYVIVNRLFLIDDYYSVLLMLTYKKIMPTCLIDTLPVLTVLQHYRSKHCIRVGWGKTDIGVKRTLELFLNV